MSTAAFAQTGPWTAEPSSLCGRDNALEMVRQQVDAAKTFDDGVKRVAVLLRAADLLWPYQQAKARAAFAEAFEVAARDFKEKGDEPRRVDRYLVATPDQRYVVIRAVARRDRAWAKSLTDEMLKGDRQAAEEASARNPAADAKTAYKLLDSAISFLASDAGAANSFAATSLGYPASLQLTRFLYKLAEGDQKAADRFYRQAFAVYGDRPLREFLYLAAYPFGLDSAGDMPVMGGYDVPPAFAPDPSLRRLFLQTLLRRARLALELPVDEGDNYNGLSGAGHILEVLTELEPHVLKLDPDMAGAVEQARSDLLNSLSPEGREAFLEPGGEQEPAQAETFDERLEAAGKVSDASVRDEHIVRAILGAVAAESTERMLKAADKIADSKTRAQVFDWVYFSGAQRALNNRQLEEAARLASKVSELDQRAYLYSEIAGAALQKIETRSQARELLEATVAEAARGRDNTAAARALLSAAYLYLKLDPGRSITVMGDAVKLVNRIESPNFSQVVMRKIECKNFVRYVPVKTPGFDPSNVFREMAKVDFDNALSLANAVADRPLRALATLDLADFCLRRAEEQEKAAKPRPKVKQ